MPLWARRVVYLVALAVALVALERGWTTDSTIDQILAALAVTLAPGLALAYPTDKGGRHRAE